MKKLLSNKKLILAGRIIMVVLLFVIAFYIFRDMRNHALQDALSRSAFTPMVSAIFVLLLYAIKSVTIFIPIVALELFTGSLFEPLPALLINILGIIVAFTIPYFVGKKVGDKEDSKLFAKFPRLEKFMSRKERGVFVPSLILRLIGFLPNDLVSVYLGTLSGSYFKYVLGSVLGSVIRIIAVTNIGSNLDNIRSPQFIASVVVILLLSVLSLVGYIFYQKKTEE